MDLMGAAWNRLAGVFSFIFIFLSFLRYKGKRKKKRPSTGMLQWPADEDQIAWEEQTSLHSASGGEK